MAPKNKASTLDRSPGWARFLWFPGDVEVRDADGKIVSQAAPKPVEEHLRDMGLSDAEIAHAMGRSMPEPPAPKRTIRKDRIG